LAQHLSGEIPLEIAFVEKVARIIQELDKHYGKKVWSRWREPVDELVRTILSQNTTDKNSLRAFANLKKRFETWEELLQADEEDIIQEIKSGGLANIKARKIKGCLTEIKKREGRIDLEILAKKPVPEALDYLLSLDGVGPKTAACVLIFSFNSPILPVDTHIHRLSNRLGIVQTNSRGKTQELLQKIIPDKDKYSFHLNLIEHGRKVCKSQKPLCFDCFLRELCSYYQNLQPGTPS